MKYWKFSQIIINWHHIFGRHNLPWQIHNTAYHIWISEIMLQQTQVNTVIPYFKKFISKFRNIQSIYHSHLNEILYIWSGLGYYARAKNIYNTAKIIINQYNGNIPKNIFILMNLPGIGKTTAGAILSLAYNFSFPILDGNIKRILIRFYNISIHQKKSIIEKKLWKIITNLTPIHHAKSFNQGMMDLGSLICRYKNPKCSECPINQNCQYIKNIIKIKNKKKNIQKKYKFFILIRYKNDILLEHRKKYKIWNHLFCFPEFTSMKNMESWLIKNNINIKNSYQYDHIYHKFTHFTLKIIIISTIIKNKTQIIQTNNNIWYNLNKPKKIGLPTPIKKILLNVKKYKKEKI